MQIITKLAVAIALVAVASCKKDQSATGDDAKEAMGLYAKGYNKLLSDGNGLVERYFDTIPKAGPKLDDKPRLFPDTFAASGIKEARASFEKANAAAPKSLEKLPPIATKLLAAADKITSIYFDAQKYYDAERYKDDKGAKAAEFHSAMLAASKEFSSAMSEMGDALSGIEDAQAADELKKYEGDKSYSYWFRYYNQQAKKFLDVAEKATDPAKLRPAYAATADAYKAIGELVKSKGNDLNSSFGSFAHDTDSFDAAATKLLRIADEKHSLDTPEFGAAYKELVNNYNSLVNMANSLYDVEAAGGLK